MASKKGLDPATTKRHLCDFHGQQCIIECDDPQVIKSMTFILGRAGYMLKMEKELTLTIPPPPPDKKPEPAPFEEQPAMGERITANQVHSMGSHLNVVYDEWMNNRPHQSITVIDDTGVERMPDAQPE